MTSLNNNVLDPCGGVISLVLLDSYQPHCKAATSYTMNPNVIFEVFWNQISVAHRIEAQVPSLIICISIPIPIRELLTTTTMLRDPSLNHSSFS